MAVKRCTRHGLQYRFGYVGMVVEAERRLKAGWTQRRCKVCGLWCVWVRPNGK